MRAFCSHYAGRRPLALWSSVAGLPGRVVSWLGDSLAGVASVAKAAAVAALVGGTAITSATFGLPAAKPRPAAVQPASADGLASQIVDLTPLRAVLPSRGTVTASRGRLEWRGPTALRASRFGRSSRAQPKAARAAQATVHLAQPGSVAPGPAQGAGQARVASEEVQAEGRREEGRVKVKPEVVPVKGKPEEVPVKGKPEEVPVKGKPEAPPGKGKQEEAKDKGKSDEAPGRGKSAAASASVGPVAG